MLALIFEARHTSAFLSPRSTYIASSLYASEKSDTESGTASQTPFYPKPRPIDEQLLTSNDGRPGAIIESIEELDWKDEILSRDSSMYPQWLQEYGETVDETEAQYEDNSDPNAMDMETIGQYGVLELESKFDYEWDPHSGEPDPNVAAMQQPGVRYLAENEKDEDNVEIGYDPMFGPSNPFDTRTILGTKESFMINDQTRDDSMLTPQFDPEDVEGPFQDQIVQFRKSLDMLETYVDPFLHQPVPRHVAKWHGYPEPMYFEPKNATNNRFTDNPTDFDKLPAWKARKLAVQMARSKNAEWLPDGVSQNWHAEQRAPYEKYSTLVGTLRKGECDPDVVEQIQPVLAVLGSSVELLSIQDGVFRFHYHGLMKNKYGMKCWAQQMIEETGAKVSGLVFETGFRKRDRAYDGGDWYNGPIP